MVPPVVAQVRWLPLEYTIHVIVTTTPLAGFITTECMQKLPQVTSGRPRSQNRVRLTQTWVSPG